MRKLKESLLQYGIVNVKEIIHNPDYDFLYHEELHDNISEPEKGELTQLGAVNIKTGEFTGRSPRDKYIVKDKVSEHTVWWNNEFFPNDNKAISPQVWDELKHVVNQQLSGKRLYVVDALLGASKKTQLKIRFVTEIAWQAHFIKNMFIRPGKKALQGFDEPDFVILTASKALNPNWRQQKLNSDVFTVFNLSEKMQLIGGTWYGGEMKKGMFAMMNYYLPLQGIASMHCSANVGTQGDVALFFGLSGTGKTTLSASPTRKLIGDDEHGWDNDGVFNFEGGCYAKTINLTPDAEPEIYAAIKRNALLENVVVKPGGEVDFTDDSITHNTRVSYPIFHMKNIVKPVSKGGHANKIIFLSADAFGVLPPVSLLNAEQIKYHFLSGFTTKIAGTERGVTEPIPTFSACFGEAFLSLPPLTYANVLLKKITQHKASAYLVNTGWNGSDKRISLSVTRAIINAILDGSINKANTRLIPVFNLRIPTELGCVDNHLLDPRNTYSDNAEWEEKAIYLARLFCQNFTKYTNSTEGIALAKAGPDFHCK